MVLPAAPKIKGVRSPQAARTVSMAHELDVILPKDSPEFGGVIMVLDSPRTPLAELSCIESG